MNGTPTISVGTAVMPAVPTENFGSEFEQHTLGWYRARLGNFTGSCIGKLMKENRQGGFSDTAMTYIYQVAATRFMNDKIVQSDKLFAEYLEHVNVETKAMRWGTEQEENARRLYARIRRIEVTERGSVEHPTIDFFASSPDGWIADDGGGRSGCLEIKCPNQDTYMRYRAEVSEARILLAVPKPYNVHRGELVRLHSLLPVADAPDAHCEDNALRG